MKTYVIPFVVTIFIVLVGGVYYVIQNQQPVFEPVTLQGVEMTTPDGFVVVIDKYNEMGISKTSFAVENDEVSLSFDTTQLVTTDAGIVMLPFTHSINNNTPAVYVGFFNLLQGNMVHEATAFLGEDATNIQFEQKEDELLVTYQVNGRDSFRAFMLKNGIVTDLYEVINGVLGDVYVQQPTPHHSVSDTSLSLEGSARGYWFFEADMPVELRDQTGNVLATSFVTAQSDWMTEDVVEFTGIIEVPDDYEGEGYLIVKRDNPSDLLENNASLRMPLSIHSGEE